MSRRVLLLCFPNKLINLIFLMTLEEIGTVGRSESVVSSQQKTQMLRVIVVLPSAWSKRRLWDTFKNISIPKSQTTARPIAPDSHDRCRTRGCFRNRALSAAPLEAFRRTDGVGGGGGVAVHARWELKLIFNASRTLIILQSADLYNYMCLLPFSISHTLISVCFLRTNTTLTS